MMTTLRTFSLKDLTTLSGKRERGRFLDSMTSEDMPRVVPMPSDGGASGEVAMPQSYDEAEHEEARRRWEWGR